MLVLSGALATTPMGCDRGPDWGDDQEQSLSAENTYTNNHYVHGVGYYHAPYHAWFPYPYNSYQAGRGYYHGGNWTSEPKVSATMASNPGVQTVKMAQSAHHSAVSRGGFGSSARSGGS
jgi:hypothetical protein